MELKKGFKNSPLGIIPNDWTTKSLGELGSFSKGSGIKKNEALSGEIPCVRYGELYTKHNDVIRQFYSFISKDISDSAKKLNKGDILFAGSGETKDEIGKSVAFTHDTLAYAGGDIVILTPYSTNSVFLGYLLNAPFIQKQKASKGQGDAVVHISASQLATIKIPLPPTLAEQTAIATVLSDTDELIRSLEQLIEKKKAIKQGMMQELLRPKKGWVVKRLGDICLIRKGQLITDNTRIEGNIPVIAGGKTPAYYHNKPNRTGKTITISGSGASAGFVSFHPYPIFASDCSTIEESANFSIEFLFFVLQLFQEDIYQKQTGGAQPHIHPDDLAPIEIPLPPLSVQQSLAQTLIDIDSEIKAINSKMKKLMDIKQGMMQELLTGKTRLI